MPPIEHQARFEKAVLWPKVTSPPYHDDFGEVIVSDSPVEIGVQWVEKRSESLDPHGVPIALDATAVVDREIEVGSKMWLGALADWYGTGSGTDHDPDERVMNVATYNVQRDIKGRVSRRTVGLQVFRRTLPRQG